MPRFLHIWHSGHHVGTSRKKLSWRFRFAVATCKHCATLARTVQSLQIWRKSTIPYYSVVPDAILTISLTPWWERRLIFKLVKFSLSYPTHRRLFSFPLSELVHRTVFTLPMTFYPGFYWFCFPRTQEHLLILILPFCSFCSVLINRHIFSYTSIVCWDSCQSLSLLPK